MTRHILAAYKEDQRIRFHGGEPSKPRGYVVNSHEVHPGIIYKDKNVTVKAFLVNHSEWRQAFGYRFETADRVIVVSGDTAPSESIGDNCNGCDILVHEVYSQAGFDRREPEWQRYHSRYHTSTLELAGIAARAKPKLLVLTHQLLWSSNREQTMGEIKQRYPGKVVFGNDLDIFDTE
jgi:ribonuclease BN (tRNA processing enzyme)